MFILWNDFLTLTNIDFSTNQTFHQFYDLDTELDLHRIMSGFHAAFATAVACQQGSLTLPDTLFRPPFLGRVCALIVATRFIELAMSLLDFHIEYPLVLSRFFLMTNITCSFSVSETIYSWTAKFTFYLLPLMSFLSHKSYDVSRYASYMNILFYPLSFMVTDMSLNPWTRF